MRTDATQKQIPDAVIEFMLTEYQTIASNRAREVERGQGYVNLFLTIASGVAALLALMSQTASVSFQFISIVILLVLLLLGMISYVRVIQRDIRLTTYARFMGRIRHYFVEIEPRIQSYLPFPPYDDKSYAPKGIERIGLKSVVALINSSVSATLIFLVTNIALDVWICAIIAVAVFGMSLIIHERFTNARYRLAEMRKEVRFPSKRQQKNSKIKI